MIALALVRVIDRHSDELATAELVAKLENLPRHRRPEQSPGPGIVVTNRGNIAALNRVPAHQFVISSATRLHQGETSQWRRRNRILSEHHRQFSLQTRFRSGSVNEPTKSMKRADDRTVMISMVDSLRNRK
jgi:hypothetical protein